MPDGIDIHVQPDGDEWVVLREGDADAISRHPTEDDAVAIGRAAARSEQSTLLIHGHDGEIKERDSYTVGPSDLNV